MSYEGPGTILGGLPVIAVLSSGKDADTPNGPGEYWTEVDSIHWRKRDGSKGKEIPQHLRDKAEAYDSYFSSLIEDIESHYAYQAYLQKHGERIVHHNTCSPDYPEKPKGEPPRPLIETEGVITCGDCGAFVTTRAKLS